MPQKRKAQAKVITSLNLKGGVGKTHLCWLIAGVCQEQGKRCLVLDLDKQGNITSTLSHSAAGSLGTDQFFDATIEPDIVKLIRPSKLSLVDVIPGSFALEQFNQTDPSAWDASGLHQSLIDPIRSVSQDYDYILLDCPADISLITFAALCASEFVLVPLEAAQWGALGTQHVQKTLSHVQSCFNANIKLLGYVVSRFKCRRKYQTAYLAEIREHFGTDAFETIIPDLSAFEQSVNDQIPVVLHSPSSHAANIAREFFEEIENRTARLRIRRN